MNINFNIDPKVLQRIATALESLAANYKIINAAALRAHDLLNTVDRNIGRTYYQSDRAVFEEELKEKQRRRQEYGEENL